MRQSSKFGICCVAAGIVSGIAQTSGSTFLAPPVADAYVASGPGGTLANNNYGGGGALVLAAPNLPKGEFQTVFKFDLSGAQAAFNAQFGAGLWSVQSVGLRLTSSPHTNPIYNNTAAGQFGISLFQNNGWTEGNGKGDTPGTTGITFNTLKNTFQNDATDRNLGTFSYDGASSGQNTYNLQLVPDLSGRVQSGGLASLRLSAADNQVSYLFTSRSGDAIERPQLVISVIPEPGVLAILGMGLFLLLWKRKS